MQLNSSTHIQTVLMQPKHLIHISATAKKVTLSAALQLVLHHYRKYEFMVAWIVHLTENCKKQKQKFESWGQWMYFV